MIDGQGRVLGRFNLVDALLVVFLLGLLPLAYATYLLFRPAAPAITSVERVEITREERRLAGGSLITAKLKVRGSGFTPMLRAALDSTPAIGFVFENPNSADIIVGDLPPGTYDVVLLDGVQEVARAAEAFTLDAAPVQRVRAAGYLLNLTAEEAKAFHAGSAHPHGDARVKVLAVGPTRPAHARLNIGNNTTDIPLNDRVERRAVVSLTCDPRADDEACSIGGVPLRGPQPTVTLPSNVASIRFAIEELFPDTVPQRVQAVVRAAGGDELRSIVAGVTDDLLDERAATVNRVAGNTMNDGIRTIELHLTLGADPSREGWRYRGQLLRPGSALSLTLNNVVIHGVLQSLSETPPTSAP